MTIQLQRKIKANRELPDPRFRRALREAVGLTQEDVAVELGVNRETVSRWESGKRRPRGNDLVHYSELLNTFRTAG